ncbi:MULTISPECIES: SDR family NAD(P)-dependent oxidoreductase [unclassified Pseudofrankia]|uniref:SDR family NAD(P)-dependent oxidoreductase n=1 Tax=unclassified Pseudofrankia TaxID=2994372 RepID=UPI0008DA090A|nr:MULTISPECIES: SDR family oxidoreductase [unclassified Pseudofrankia]MDT3445769.1 SDR family oxidoreductase [Pseudofrankia sp. BMG5.37]OHV62778.1 short-chain dehydrogenase [Pseudofrankia sp. BMG5.36]
MGSLDGKAAVITGAGRGIGKACVEVFVREGAKVLAVDVSGEEKDVAAALGPAVVPFHADLTREDDVVAAFDTAAMAFGRVDALVNVAGTPGSRPVEYLDADHYEAMTSVNLRGVLLATRHAVRAMLTTGGGSIVTVASVAGTMNIEARTPVVYMAAKAGAHVITKSVAVEYGPKGIRANTVAPGFTLTETTGRAPAETIAAMSAKATLGRAATAVDQAEMIAFLSSDRAAFVNGVLIPVDGGWSARMV